MTRLYYQIVLSLSFFFYLYKVASSDICHVRNVPLTHYIADKNERTNYVVIKGESMLRELPSKVAKVLGYSQLVKTMNENQVDLPEGETYKPVCEHTCDSLLRATPRANCSFLWNKHRAKNLLNDQQDATTYYSLKENNEGTDNEAYDDVGPSNFAAQAVRIMMYNTMRFRYNVTAMEFLP